jgi:alpha-beta hydrolase superfamily lysophospholipase
LIVVAVIVVLRAFDARSLPDISAWHEVRLTEEFGAGSGDFALADYIAAEGAVLEQVEREIESDIVAAVHRFNPEGVFNSQNHARDWNRTTELEPGVRRGTALLLHGVSDSPYSLRSTAEYLRGMGFHSLVLRLPGHGTAPAGLGQVHWEDWRAAVRIAASHLARIGEIGEPFIVVGYSNGGALAIDYALDALEDDTLVAPDRLVLLSPAIGITPFAFFASWNRSLSWLPFFRKFAWESVLPEYDPYKYNSFPKAAGNETFELTQRVQKRLRSLADRDKLPPILTFAPLVDATVRTEATVQRLYEVLNRDVDELVLYDINRFAELSQFLRADHRTLLDRIDGDGARRYGATVISNESTETRQVVATTSKDGVESVEHIEAEWPAGIHSLSHVALPFPTDDPWYGDGTADTQHPTLGRLSTYGERNLLIVSPAQIARLRYNPFYEFQARKIAQFVGQEAGND